MIDLRTDTVTRPTPGMLRAMVAAEVGDEQKREDPTVIALEERAAELVGHEEAVFVPSATMANQIALRLLGQPGETLVASATSHVVRSEESGHAVHSGLVLEAVDSADGRFAAADLVDGPGVVTVENTHSGGGGRVWSPAAAAELTAAARRAGLRPHLDGARLLNAALAAGVPASTYGRCFDAVTLCLSKGLGCPFGALLAGSRETLADARRTKQLFGGAMRQSGVVAAAGLYALDHHVDRLADDHENARVLAEGWAAAGLPVEPEQVETNFVLLHTGSLGLDDAGAIERLQAAGVLVSRSARPGILRAVTHLDVTAEDVRRAVAAAPAALGAAVA